ncbi:MAG: MFS transporter [Armatimonadetes bacterium]|nr:MFS transporter [Armatimonadota bacterium]
METTHTNKAGRGRDALQAYRLGIANGVLFAFGAAFIDPTTVLPSLVSRLTTSEVLIGVVATIGTTGWFLPQLLAANYLQSRPYKRPLYIFAAVFRFLGLFAVIPVLYFLAPRHPGLALLAFFGAYTCYALAGGTSGPAFLDIVAKTVPPIKLGAFFGHRQFWGGLGAMGCGLLVREILGSDRLGFPQDYTLLFVCGLAFFAPGWVAFASVREPPGRVTDDPKPLLPFLFSAPTAIRQHREFRLLLASRLLNGAVGIALPFYVVYAHRVLEVPEATIGTYVSLQMAGSVALVPLWAFLNDRRGPRALLLAVAVLYFGAVSLAFVTSLFPQLLGFGRLALMGVFFSLAAIGAGSFMGYTNYLFAIAPEEERTLYIGLQNTLFAFTSLLPLLGGVIVAAASFSILFGLAAVFGLAAIVATARLPRRLTAD